MFKTKDNNGGDQQPYIPKGHGEKSGQFTFKNFSGFAYREKCTKSNLEKLLTKEEIKCLVQYTDYNIGTLLNYSIRNNTLDSNLRMMKNNIISSIKKHQLKNDIIVFRGIKISKKYFINYYCYHYKKKDFIYGSEICSTSRDIKRAIKGSYSASKDMVSLVFEINLPKNYNALPIEEISQSKKEKEILLSKPCYKIEAIEEIETKPFKYYKIKVLIK